jgi:hypothetical protein
VKCIYSFAILSVTVMSQYDKPEIEYGFLKHKSRYLRGFVW